MSLRMSQPYRRSKHQTRREGSKEVNIKIVWSAVLATVLAVTAVVVAISTKEGSAVAVALGLASVTSALLSSRE